MSNFRNQKPTEMKRHIYAALAILAVCISLQSCKKDSNDNDTELTELPTQSDDQSRFATETDGVANDVNTVLSGMPIMNGRNSGTAATPCDATVTADTVGAIRKVTITYNGLNCQGTRKRNGTVIVTMPATVKWKDAGAVLTVTIQDLAITRVSDGKTITVNGVETITNTSGGRVIDVTSPAVSVTHNISSNGMTVLFDDGTSRKWMVAKKRVFSYDGGLVIKTSGTYNNGNLNNISEWGTNRLGNSFVCYTVEPVTVRQSCNFRVTGGIVKHERSSVATITSTTTFGLDANGNATSCPGTGSYYFKVEWTGPNGKSHTVIKPY